MDQSGIVGFSGGGVERGNVTPDCQAFSHLGSPSVGAEPMPSRPKVCGYAAKGRQELLGRTRDQRISGEPFRGKSADSHHVQYNNTFRNFCDRLKLADSGSFPVRFGE